MVDGNTTANFTFIDPDTDQKVTITLTWRDGVYFKILEKMNQNLERIRSRLNG